MGLAAPRVQLLPGANSVRSHAWCVEVSLACVNQLPLRDCNFYSFESDLCKQPYTFSFNTLCGTQQALFGVATLISPIGSSLLLSKLRLRRLSSITTPDVWGGMSAGCMVVLTKLLMQVVAYYASVAYTPLVSIINTISIIWAYMPHRVPRVNTTCYLTSANDRRLLLHTTQVPETSRNVRSLASHGFIRCAADRMTRVRQRLCWYKFGVWHFVGHLVTCKQGLSKHRRLPQISWDDRVD